MTKKKKETGLIEWLTGINPNKKKSKKKAKVSKVHIMYR